MKPLAPCRCFWTPPEYRPEAYNKANGQRALPIRRVSSPLFCIYPPRGRGRVASADGQSQVKIDPRDLEPAILGLPLAVVEYVNPDSAREPRWRRWVLANIDCNKVAHDIVNSSADREPQLDNHGGGLSCERAIMKAEEDYMAALDAEFQEKAKDQKQAAKKLKQWESFSQKVKQDEGSLTMELRAAKDVADEVYSLRDDLKASEKKVKKLERKREDLEILQGKTQEELEETEGVVEARNQRNAECCQEIDELRKELQNAENRIIENSEMADSTMGEQATMMLHVKTKLRKFESDNADLRNKCLIANKSFFKKEQKDKVALLETMQTMDGVKSELEESRSEVAELKKLYVTLDKVRDEAKEAHKLRLQLKKAHREAEKLNGMRRRSSAPTDVKSEYQYAEQEVEKLKRPHCQIDAVQESDPLYNEVASMLRSQGLPNVQIEAVYRTEMDEQYREKYDLNVTDKREANLWLGFPQLNLREMLNCEHCLDYRQFLTFGRLGKGLYGWEYAVYPDASSAFETEDKIRSLLLYKAIIGKAFDFRDATQEESRDDNPNFQHPLNKTSTYWAPPYGYDSVTMPQSAICPACVEIAPGAEVVGKCTCPIMPYDFQPEMYNETQGWAKNKIPYRRRISSPMYCLSRPAPEDDEQAQQRHPENGLSQHWGREQKSKTLCDFDEYICALPLAVVEYRNPDTDKEPPWRLWALDQDDDGGPTEEDLGPGFKLLESEVETERSYLRTIDEDKQLHARLLRKAEGGLKTWEQLLNTQDTHHEKHREVTEQSESLRQELEEQAKAAEQAAEKMREDNEETTMERSRLESSVAELTEALEEARSYGSEMTSKNESMQEYEEREQEMYSKERAESNEQLESVREELEANQEAFSEFREEYEPFREVAESVDDTLMVPIKMYEALGVAKAGKDYEAICKAIDDVEEKVKTMTDTLDLPSVHAAAEKLEMKGPAGPLLSSLVGKTEEKTLDLRKKEIDDEKFKVLCKRFPKFTKLSKLLLNDNAITPDGFEKFLVVLPQLQQVVEVNLTGNKVGDVLKVKLKDAWKKMGKDAAKLIMKD